MYSSTCFHSVLLEIGILPTFTNGKKTREAQNDNKRLADSTLLAWPPRTSMQANNSTSLG